MKLSWDYEIPNIWKNKSHVPNYQQVIHNQSVTNPQTNPQ